MKSHCQFSCYINLRFSVHFFYLFSLIFFCSCSEKKTRGSESVIIPGQQGKTHNEKFASKKISKNSDETRILFLGDSLTAGYGIEKKKAYPELLKNKLSKTTKVKVYNGGVSGSTSASGISRFKWFLKEDLDIVVLALGANDGLRGVPIKSLKKNLEGVIRLAKKEKIKVLLLGMMLPPNYGEAYRKKFRQVYIDLKNEYKLPWVPFMLEGVAAQKSKNIEDGIHPNEQGHKIMADNIFESLRSLL